MFEQIQAAPPDAIIGLTEAFLKDPSLNKINLSVGVYKDSQGQTPVLASVKQAEQRILTDEPTKNYLGIDGLLEYRTLVRELMFGKDHEILSSNRAETVQAPGGTGALRVAADFIHQLFPSSKIWCSQPTWANHPKVFQAAGVEVDSYPYFDAQTNGLAFDQMLSCLEKIPAGDAICLHACCHNPTGVDPTAEQWAKIADIVYERGLLPLLDFAYQGFGDGWQEDTTGLNAFTRPGCELLIASSYSKNFSLYRERVGALTAVATDSNSAGTVLSQLKSCVRANYSNPPAHGALIITTILGDNELRQQWEAELAEMRNRINSMRQSFVEIMAKKCPGRDFLFIARQKGMFSYSGLTAEQVDELREKHALYVIRNGRINVGGLTEGNIEAACTAIASVI